MKHINYISLILISLFTYSCKTAVEAPSLINGDDKVFVQSFLNPQAPQITIGLSIARGVNPKGDKIPKDVLSSSDVNISNGIITKNIPFQYFMSSNIALFALDQSEFPLTPGATYTLTIDNGTYYSLKAQSTIPSAAFSYTYTITGPHHGVEGSNYYVIENTVTDAAGENSFYKVGIYDTLESYYYYDNIFFDDAAGTKTIINNKIELDEWIVTSEEYKISIANVSEDTYKYLKSIQAIRDNDGNPFAEPTTLHSNIEGGLGIFGAMYNKDMRIHR